MLLPARVRDPATALYAFCRLADDAVDLETRKFAALDKLRERLDLLCAGQPLPLPADRAFAAVMTRFAIPRELPAALLEGFEWDAAARRYETLADLRAYALRVAGTVGVMMSLIMGARAREVLARACELGMAMQLTNIARDVGEDARAGRLYLPLQWLREEGVDAESWLRQPEFHPGIARITQRLLVAADELYASAASGIAWLPVDCRPSMQAARVLYAEIGREVERRALDSVTGRAQVSGGRKLALLPRILGAALARREALSTRVPEEARALVEIVARQSAASGADSKLVRMLDLFERLERRQLAASPPRGA